MFEQSQPFPESLDFLGKFAQTRAYLMAALNNESLEINEYRIHKFHLRDYFRGVFQLVLSRECANRKKQIYRLALKITQREPEECVLIDDRGLNLELRARMGMHTIQFQNARPASRRISRNWE